MAGFFKNLYNKVSNRADVDWDELEAELIAADLGVRIVRGSGTLREEHIRASGVHGAG